MKIAFLGTDSVLPVDGNDTASYLVDENIVIDVGFAAYQRLRAIEADLKAVDHLLLTHLHQDHYIGLPGLLFGLAHSERQLRQLRIYGPANAGLPELIETTLRFLRAHEGSRRAPEIKLVELQAGESLVVGRYQVHVESTRHAVPTLAYRFEQDGRRLLTVCGDSAPHPPLVAFARGSELLVHEAAMAELSPDAASDGSRGHSTPFEAAELAAAAEVGSLAIVHFPRSAAADRLHIAKPVFANTLAPIPGEVIDLEALVRAGESSSENGERVLLGNIDGSPGEADARHG